MGYVIYLSGLGYYAGKTYIHQGEMFAIAENAINMPKKVYKNKKVAENVALKLYQRCSNVVEYEVCEES